MRLLFLTSRLPYPPNRGDRLRAYHFLRSLSQEHEITLISFIDNVIERKLTASLMGFCRDVEVVLMSPLQSVLATGLNLWRKQPLQALYYRSRAMQRLIDQKIQSGGFEAVYVHLFRMAPYVAHHADLYRIVDLTDVISQEIARSLPYRSLPSQLIYALERARIQRYEREIARRFEEVWLISEADKEVLREACPGANIQVVKNGVDTDRFHPLDGVEQANSLIFVGHLGVFHNVDAAVYLAREILPLVRREIPEAELKLAGAEPSSRVRALGKLPGVTVTGYVSDLNQALNEAAIFAAPLRFAAGVQNKVLEAMAAGRPVVTTSPVNQGLGAIPDQDLVTADTPGEISRWIVRLLRDAEMRKRIGGSGLAFVRRNYRWSLVAERMGAIERGL